MFLLIIIILTIVSCRIINYFEFIEFKPIQPSGVLLKFPQLDSVYIKVNIV